MKRHFAPTVLAFAAALSMVATKVTCAERMYAVIVSDTSEAAGWGEYLPNIQTDTVNIFAMLFNNVPERQLELYPLELESNDFSSPANILQALRETSPGPNDVFFFYFTGHGGSDDRGHYLELAQGRLYRQKIRETLQQLGARLNVVLTDCCNIRGDGQDFVAAAPRLQSPPVVTPLFRSLFFESRGFVDINASSPGEAAFFTPLGDPPEERGSLFTNALVDYTYRYQQQHTNWEHLLRSVSLNVHLAFRHGYPRGARAGKGAHFQTDQNVFAVEYPGMPEKSGPRLGATFRDHQNRGAMILRVEPALPASKVFDLTARSYVSLRPGQLVTVINGHAVRGAADVRDLLARSPQVARLTIQDRRGEREMLLRLRY